MTDRRSEIARQMRANGLPWKDVADALGVCIATAKRLADPEALRINRKRSEERRTQQWREGLAGKRAAGLRGHAMSRVTDEDLAARLAEIPPDTRDLTARIFGDPIPGRRALDMRGTQ